MNELLKKIVMLSSFFFCKKVFVFLVFILLTFNGAHNAQPRRFAQPAQFTAPPVLQIIRALYGDLTLQAGVSDATLALQKSVRNNQLVLPAQTKTTWLGDPAPGRAKSLLIIFRIENNVYLKLIADAAGDTISPATVQSAMLLISQPQVVATQAQQPAVQQTQAPPAPVQQVQMSSATAATLAGAGAVMTQPGAAQQQQAPVQNKLSVLQQSRLQQFRK